ncbi:Glutamate receptor 4 [Nymphon striatum]|nr:Glutamate receptor 4 [Nymphon striatum]
MICTCRRYGLKCVAACGKCRGEICENAETTATETVNEDDIDNDGNIFDILDEMCMNGSCQLIFVTFIKSLTGNISFDKFGRRTGFSLDVVQMDVNTDMTKIAEWSDANGFALNPPKYTRNRPDMSSANKTFIVTTILVKRTQNRNQFQKINYCKESLRRQYHPKSLINYIDSWCSNIIPYFMMYEEPYLMERKPGPGVILEGNDRYEGYCAELAQLIARHMNINYKLKLVNDSEYGAYFPDSPQGWNGMIGELIRGEADIAIAPLTITSEREQVVYFTKPYMSMGISIMIKQPRDKTLEILSFMNPLSTEIWMSVIFAYVGVSVVLFLVSRFSPYEWQMVQTKSGVAVSNDFSIYNSLWFALGAFMQQGIDICPRSVSGRIVGSCWWMFTLIIISSYTANLAAFLTVERMVSPINSAEDLAKQTEVEYGVYNSGSTKSFFKVGLILSTKIPTYTKMWQFMTAHPHVFAKNYQEGIERVRSSNGQYAFLLESTKNEYINERQPCNTMKVGRNLDAKGYGVATPYGSPLRVEINLSVLFLKENGDLARLMNKWWYDRSECARDKKKDSRQNELRLEHVAGIFYILVGGMIVALVVVMMEFCYKSRVDSRMAKVPLSEEIRVKARMSIRGSDADSYTKNDISKVFLNPCSGTVPNLHKSKMAAMPCQEWL